MSGGVGSSDKLQSFQERAARYEQNFRAKQAEVQSQQPKQTTSERLGETSSALWEGFKHPLALILGFVSVPLGQIFVLFIAKHEGWEIFAGYGLLASILIGLGLANLVRLNRTQQGEMLVAFAVVYFFGGFITQSIVGAILLMEFMAPVPLDG